jgi:hypothetical protein
MGFKLRLIDIGEKFVLTFCSMFENGPFLSICFQNLQNVLIFALKFLFHKFHHRVLKNMRNFMLILNSLNWVQKMCRKKLKAKKQRKKVHNPKTQN